MGTSRHTNRVALRSSQLSDPLIPSSPQPVGFFYWGHSPALHEKGYRARFSIYPLSVKVESAPTNAPFPWAPSVDRIFSAGLTSPMVALVSLTRCSSSRWSWHNVWTGFSCPPSAAILLCGTRDDLPHPLLKTNMQRDRNHSSRLLYWCWPIKTK